jgi:hypothetical protein
VERRTEQLGLFFYASFESQNHRRREADRQRISLRIAAIESYIEQRRSMQDPDVASKLLDEFIREHFILPSLDSNDMTYIGPRRGLFSALQRGGSKEGSGVPPSAAQVPTN